MLERLDELVVKEVHGSGGYGMLIGPHSTAAERTEFAEKIRRDPDGYIASRRWSFRPRPPSPMRALPGAMSISGPIA